jgi:ATP-binding cassette subfamily B protein/subfamily B ATP-binding cassette protein MsbA
VQVGLGQHLVYDLRGRLFDHLQSLGLRHHISTNTGDAAYRIEADAYSIENLVVSGLFPLASSFLTLAVMFAILANMDVTIALLSLSVVPFLYVGLRYYMTSLVNQLEHVKALESKLMERVYETFASMKLVKSFAREPYESARFRSAGTTAMNARLAVTWQESLFSVAVTAITIVGTGLVLGVGGMKVLRQQMTIGDLLVVIAYLHAVYDPLSAIAHTAGQLPGAIAGARRVRAAFAMTPETVDESGAVDAAAVRGEIRFESVGFAYDDGTQILRDITFTARPGELVALVGVTGAGKTTLVSLIPRFFDATEGRVLVDGIDVRGYKVRSLRNRIAVVPQEPVLFSGTIADNIRYGNLEATDDEVERAARAAYAHDFVSRLPKGYGTAIAEAGGSLSGGERQRLSVARALLKEAPILILDEPTSSLDAISEEIVFRALRRLRAGRTTLIIAHRLATVQDADRILVLDSGQIVAHGRHEQLLETSELYRRLSARLVSPDGPDTPRELAGTVS